MGKNKTLVVVDDHTRHTPLFESLWAGDIMVATGSHVPFNETQRIGCHYDKVGIKILEHNQKDIIEHGGFFINGKIFQYDSLLLVGSIFPHATVGWSAGPKAIIPGLAGLKTIADTHWKALEWTMANDDRMDSILGVWDNPIREEIVGMVRTLPHDIKILNFVLGCEKNRKIGIYPLDFDIVDWVFGDIEYAHFQGHLKSMKEWQRPVQGKRNIVYADVLNTSYTLRQAIKGICSADIVCNDGGYIILDTRASMVAPQFNDEFEKEGFGDPERTYEKAVSGKISKLVAYTLVTIGKIMQKKKVILVNPNMTKESAIRLGFSGYAKDYKEARKLAQSDFQEEPYTLDDAGLVLPRVC